MIVIIVPRHLGPRSKGRFSLERVKLTIIGKGD